MAALVKHVLSKSNLNIVRSSLVNVVLVQQTRGYKPQNPSKRNKVKPKKLEKWQVPETRRLESVGNSVASRGFLRCLTDYTPPADVEEQLEAVFSETVGLPPSDPENIPSNRKFDVLNRCYNAFLHGVPNSILHRINTYGDLKEFYLTPVKSTLPLEKLKTADLPPNLNIQLEPIRFHPDDDMMFKGQTAFPKSNTIVTGLRAKRKYRGYKVTESWNVF